MLTHDGGSLSCECYTTRQMVMKGKIHHVGVTSVEDPTLGSSLFVTLRKVLFPQAIHTSCLPDKSKELDHRAS
jgi:hypothetical protein